MEALRIEGLCKRYPAFSLENVSFSVESGQIMGLIGRNGAGKTTTLRALLHVVHPDAGKISLLGLDMAAHERQIRGQLGFVSGTGGYYPRKRLGQITAVTRAFYDSWDDAAYQACLRRFSLDENRRMCELSEGMKVKYQLALALSHRARLLILDEPTSGLDPVSRDDLLEVFLHLAEAGVTILFSTHITSDLEHCADAVTFLQNGRVRLSAPRAQLLRQYCVVRGTAAACTPALRAALHGCRIHHDTFEGLLPAQDAALATGCTVTEATLEQIMVFLEREDVPCGL